MDEIPVEQLEAIQATLRHFGITQRYSCFNSLTYVIYLVIDDESRLQSITKEIYIATALKFNCPWPRISRQISYGLDRAWNTDKEFLCSLAGYPMTRPPYASEFVEILAKYVKSTLSTRV